MLVWIFIKVNEKLILQVMLKLIKIFTQVQFRDGKDTSLIFSELIDELGDNKNL